MITYLITNNFALPSRSFSSSHLIMTIEKAAINDYHIRGKFSRIFSKNKPVQTNSDYKGYS